MCCEYLQFVCIVNRFLSEIWFISVRLTHSGSILQEKFVSRRVFKVFFSEIPCGNNEPIEITDSHSTKQLKTNVYCHTITYLFENVFNPYVQAM